MWILAPKMESGRAPLGWPRAASYSLKFWEEELALWFMPRKSSFAQRVRWLPQSDPAVSYVARKKIVLTDGHLFAHFSSLY